MRCPSLLYLSLLGSGGGRVHRMLHRMFPIICGCLSSLPIHIPSRNIFSSAIMTHASVPAEERIKLGITDNLIRLSVGLEDTDDLIQDLDQALNAVLKVIFVSIF